MNKKDAHLKKLFDEALKEDTAKKKPPKALGRSTTSLEGRPRRKKPTRADKT